MAIIIFPTAIEIFDLSDHPDLPKLRSLIYKEEKNLKPHELVSNALSSYSNGREYILNHFAVRNLKKDIEKCVDMFRNDLGLGSLELRESWFNILEKGHYVSPHRHELSKISGAFYIEAEDGSCDLKFHSPLSQNRMAEFIKDDNMLNKLFHKVECKVGHLILFPSWLEHSTDINYSSKRITVSFNTDYGPSDIFQKEYNEWFNRR